LANQPLGQVQVPSPVERVGSFVQVADHFGLSGGASYFLRNIQHCFKELRRLTRIKYRLGVSNAVVVDDNRADIACDREFSIWWTFAHPNAEAFPIENSEITSSRRSRE
jgi:hypothetical protein